MLARDVAVRGLFVMAAATAPAACTWSEGTTTPTPPFAAAHTSTHAAAAPMSLDYAGTFAETDTVGDTTRLQLDQRIQAMPRTLGGRSVTVFRGVETDTGTAHSSTSFRADVAEVPSSIRNGTDTSLLRTSSASSGLEQTTVYGSGNGVFNEVPEVPQARWHNTASRSLRLTDPSGGTSLSDTFHSDGSYDEVSVPVEGLHASLQSYPDGNGLYEWPFDGASINSTITYSPQRRGDLNVLFVNAAFHVTELIRIKSWYKSPPELATDSFRDVGTATVPASCGTSKRFGKTAFEIDESTKRLDFVFGEYEALQRVRYVSPTYGLLCFIAVDKLQTYYDYSSLTLSATPLGTTTITEFLGLQATTVPNDDRSAEVALPLDVRIDMERGSQRLSAAQAILQALAHLRKH